MQCSKCYKPICTSCMVSTPVGMRCKACAELRRPVQFDVSTGVLARAAIPGFACSLGCWYLVSLAPFLRYFLAILVGVAVGEVMSRLAHRRSNRLLEIMAVAVVVAGLLLIEIYRAGDLSAFRTAITESPGYLVSLAVPAGIASLVAVMKLR